MTAREVSIPLAYGYRNSAAREPHKLRCPSETTTGTLLLSWPETLSGSFEREQAFLQKPQRRNSRQDNKMVAFCHFIGKGGKGELLRA